MPLTTAWRPEAAKPRDITRISGHGTDMDPGFILAWGSSMDHRHQHSLKWHHWPHWSLEEVQYSK